jgi:hypothetical protein
LSSANVRPGVKDNMETSDAPRSRFFRFIGAVFIVPFP